MTDVCLDQFESLSIPLFLLSFYIRVCVCVIGTFAKSSVCLSIFFVFNIIYYLSIQWILCPSYALPAIMAAAAIAKREPKTKQNEKCHMFFTCVCLYFQLIKLHMFIKRPFFALNRFFCIFKGTKTPRLNKTEETTTAGRKKWFPILIKGIRASNYDETRQKKILLIKIQFFILVLFIVFQ